MTPTNCPIPTALSMLREAERFQRQQFVSYARAERELAAAKRSLNAATVAVERAADAYREAMGHRYGLALVGAQEHGT